MTRGGWDRGMRLEVQICVFIDVLCVVYPVCKVALTFFNFLVVTAPFQRDFQQPRVKISGVFWAQIENPLQRWVWYGPRGDSGVVQLTRKPLGQTKLERGFVGPSSPFPNSLLALGCVLF